MHMSQSAHRIQTVRAKLAERSRHQQQHACRVSVYAYAAAATYSSPVLVVVGGTGAELSGVCAAASAASSAAAVLPVELRLAHHLLPLLPRHAPKLHRCQQHRNTTHISLFLLQVTSHDTLLQNHATPPRL